MNAIMESLYPDKGVVLRRRERGLQPLDPQTDTFSAYLHEEMRVCYLNGHDHAALVTGCALIDFAVKDAIEFDEFVKAGCVFNPETWDEIDVLQFGTSINRAKRRGLINRDEGHQLQWLRKHVRNVYMHGQTPHWVKDKDGDSLEGNLETGEIQERKGKTRDNIVLQRLARIAGDRNICDDVVHLIDKLVRALAARAMHALQEYRSRHPTTAPSNEQLGRILQSMKERNIGMIVVGHSLPVFDQDTTL